MTCIAAPHVDRTSSTCILYSSIDGIDALS